MFNIDSVNRGLEPHGLRLVPLNHVEATVTGGPREMKFNAVTLLKAQWRDCVPHDLLIQRAVASIVAAVNAPDKK